MFPDSDFNADVTIFTEPQGGRSSPVRNGIRWDLCYAADDVADGLWQIWPDFLNTDGDSLPDDVPLPTDTVIPARFCICRDSLRPYHSSRIGVGVEFYCHEGARRVAHGVVTEVTGLGGASGG